MPKKQINIGLYMEDDVSHVDKVLTEVREAGFDYLCCGIVTNEYRKNAMEGFEDKDEPFSWFDMSLPSSEWYSSVIGVVSSCQQYTDSPKSIERERSCELLTKELGYAQHLGFISTMVNLDPGKEAANFTRLLNSKVTYDETTHSNLTLWVRVPMVTGHRTETLDNGSIGGLDMGELDGNVDCSSATSSWNAWNNFRTASGGERRMFPVLDFPLDLPDDAEINRWLGEQVKAVCLSEDCFISNSKGFPVLPKRTQKILKQFIELGSQVIINCKAGKAPMLYSAFKQYTEFLMTRYYDEWDQNTIRKFSKGYEDFLQSPLQPLMDNLEANTYEVFERDPVKYTLYQNAIAKALLSKVSEEEKNTKTLVVMVVGAGRGPLVRNCLLAADSVDRQVKVFAVEKNVNAICTLLHLKKRIWGDKVTVVSSDMRDFNPDEKADIIVSELLGSFGDNELSPECLDGAQRFLKDDGIMIPQSYTSYISPVMSQKLHNELRSFQDINKHTLSSYETPYVVLMKNFYEIDKPKELFKFTHPKPDATASNYRYGTAEFTAELDCLMHGIAGYFDCHLFGGVDMSIHPETHSEGMFSWFQIYFPIKEPLHIRKGDVIKIHFWRCSNKHNVWYEWSVSSPFQIPIHNVNGRSYTIGL